MEISIRHIRTINFKIRQLILKHSLRPRPPKGYSGCVPRLYSWILLSEARKWLIKVCPSAPSFCFETLESMLIALVLHMTCRKKVVKENSENTRSIPNSVLYRYLVLNIRPRTSDIANPKSSKYCTL